MAAAAFPVTTPPARRLQPRAAVAQEVFHCTPGAKPGRPPFLQLGTPDPRHRRVALARNQACEKSLRMIECRWGPGPAARAA